MPIADPESRYGIPTLAMLPALIEKERKLETKDKSAAKGKSNGNGSATRTRDPEAVSAESSQCPTEQMIAQAAYYIAERRGFAPNNDLADWLQAEAEVSSRVKGT